MDVIIMGRCFSYARNAQEIEPHLVWGYQVLHPRVANSTATLTAILMFSLTVGVTVAIFDTAAPLVVK